MYRSPREISYRGDRRTEEIARSLRKEAAGGEVCQRENRLLSSARRRSAPPPFSPRTTESFARPREPRNTAIFSRGVGNVLSKGHGNTSSGPDIACVHKRVHGACVISICMPIRVPRQSARARARGALLIAPLNPEQSIDRRDRFRNAV